MRFYLPNDHRWYPFSVVLQGLLEWIFSRFQQSTSHFGKECEGLFAQLHSRTWFQNIAVCDILDRLPRCNSMLQLRLILVFLLLPASCHMFSRSSSLINWIHQLGFKTKSNRMPNGVLFLNQRNGDRLPMPKNEKEWMMDDVMAERSAGT